jgi:hypothetical protein
MKTNRALLASLMELPEAERFEIAMAVLDQSSPAGLAVDEIIGVVAGRQDEMESGAVADIGYDELAAGLNYRPQTKTE